ncbi:MAG: hypothetical protein QM790_00290 [Nibricoccus sp.]
MRNRKLDRALYGPSIYEITFGVIFSVLLGAALAVFFLIFKPAEEVSEMPKEDQRVRGVTYYVPGTFDAVKSKQWRRKVQMVLESSPGEVSFSEDDLNMCILSNTEGGKKVLDKAAKEAAAAQNSPAKGAPAKPGAKPAPAAPQAATEPPPPEAPPSELFTPGAANFRVRDGVVQVGLPSTLNTLGYQFPIILQARGGFEKTGDMYVYVPDEVMIGSLPLHRFPHAVEFLMKKAMASEAIPPEALAAWKKVKTVVVDGKVIKLTI